MRGLDEAIDAAAAALGATSRAFTAGNVYYAVRRACPELGADLTLPRFSAALVRRQRRGPIQGLLPTGGPRPASRSKVAPKEWSAYFPAAILLVDHPAIVDLFVASGVLVQARIAVVCVDGTPAPIVSWLRRGIRAGHRAPVGFLHDARTVMFPFLCQPLATLVEASRGEPLAYLDLGIGPGRPMGDPFGTTRAWVAEATYLEEIPPCSLVAHAAQELLRMTPPDLMLLPMGSSATRVA